MKYNYEKFNKDNYFDMMAKNKTDHCGSIYKGDLCIEIIAESDTYVDGILTNPEFISVNFYVLGEDTNYGYTKTGIPYDYAEGFDILFPYGLGYEDFIRKLEKMMDNYINSYKGSYSLKAHANRPTAIW